MVAETKRKPKPSKKAASPFPDSEFEDSVDEVPREAPPAKKQRGGGKAKKADAKPEASADSGLDEEKATPKKRKYSPKKGTANHAFLAVLYEAHKNGEETLTKADIMDRADKSGLSERPIFGTEDSTSPAGFPVDGWTNFKTLKKHELVVAEGRPLKVHLTEEGKAVAEGLDAA